MNAVDLLEISGGFIVRYHDEYLQLITKELLVEEICLMKITE